MSKERDVISRIQRKGALNNMAEFFQKLWAWIVESPWTAALVIFIVAAIILACLGWTTYSIEVGEFKIIWTDRDEAPFASACISGLLTIIGVIFLGLVPLLALEAAFEDDLGFINSPFGLALYCVYGAFVIARMTISYIRYEDDEDSGVAKIISGISIIILLGAEIVLPGIVVLGRLFG